nr:uncharacterized mitochondrial protein AtMg00810-like [Tanacetum cinerariifolium]
MDSLSTLVVSATKLPILNPNEFDLWKMRIEQYFLMTDYSLWEVIINGDYPVPTIVVDGVVQPVSHKSAKQKVAKRNELKARGTFLMALPDKHQLKFNSHKDAKTLMKAIEKRFRGNTETKKRNKADLEEHSLDDLFNSLKIYEAKVKHSSSLVSAATSVSAVCAKLHVSFHPNIDFFSNAVIFSFFASQSTTPPLDNKDLKQIDVDDLEEIDLRWQMAMLTMRARRKGHFARECRSPKDSRRSSLEENIKLLNVEVQARDTALVTLRQKLNQAEHERDALKLKLDKFQSSSKNLTELLASQANDKHGLGYFSSESDCKSLSPIPLSDRIQPNGGYHVVPPPITGTFMPPKPDLVFRTAPIVVETDHSAFTVQVSPSKPAQDLSHTNRPSARITEDWVSDSEDESKINDPQSVPSFVQSSKQVKTPRHSVQPVEAPILDAILKPTNLKFNMLTQSKSVSITAIRPVSAALPKIMVTRPRHAHSIDTKSKSPIRRHITRSPTPKTSNLPHRVTAAQAPVVTAAKGKKGKWGNPQYALKDKGVIDSGCSRHMTWNMSYLSDFEELNGGYVTYGGNPKGGKISECLVLTPEFKLPDESQVLLKVPRENNMYNVNLKNIVPSGDLTCLFAKAIIDESNLWHRRLGHINFKTINKLVTGNLVRGLPTKVFENNNTYVACKKGKQHRASCKTKPVSYVDQPLFRLHMDLFGPTFVKILNKKSYCLVITDDYSRFTWVFFLATKDETSPILKTFITGPENQLSLKVKLHIYRRPLLDDYKKGKKFNDLQLFMCGDMFKDSNSYLESRGSIEDFVSFREMITSQLLYLRGNLNNMSLNDLRSYSISTKELCKAYEKLMKDKFQMSSMGELTFFLGLQVKQKEYGIFISQDKYVAKILRKFGLTDGKSASTPIDTEKPLLKDPDGEDVDVHTYRSMIGSLMYLTSLRPDIMFVVCACACFQVTPKASHLHAVKRIFRCLKGKPHLGLWYPKDSPLNLVAYSDSDYAGHTVVATSSTGAKYVAAASCYAQVLWIQNQLLDYGLVKNVDSPSKFLMYLRFLQLMINAQVGDLSSHTTKYTSPSLTQKVFANIRRVEDEDAANQISVEPTPPSPTPATTPPPPQQDLIPSSPQATSTPPLSPHQAQDGQPSLPPPQQPLQPEDISQSAMSLLNTLGGCQSQAQVYHLDLEHAQKVLSMQDTDEAEPAEVKEANEVVIATKLMTEVVTTDATTITNARVPKTSAPRRKNGVVIRDPRETATSSVIVHFETKSKDKGKVILVEEPKPLKRQAHIEQDEAFARELEAELNVTLTGMIGMTYTEIRPIFKKHYTSIQAFLDKGEKEIDEEGSKRKSDSPEQKAAKKQRINEEVKELKTHLQIVPNDEDDAYTKATPLALKVPVVDYQIHHEYNKPYFKIIRADGTHQLFLSFITLLKNFDREDLEMLWKLVQERFQSLEPKNFTDDFLLNTLKTMFENPNVEASIWRDQRGRYGLAKSWKLLESCRVHILTLTTTQMILLVEKKYPLIRFTLEKMLNNVRLEAEADSKTSLELLRLVRRLLQEGYTPE